MTTLTTNCANTCTARQTRVPFGQKLALYIGTARQRRALAKLDNAALRDIGVTPAQAEKEAKKPFWDAPAHWFH